MKSNPIVINEIKIDFEVMENKVFINSLFLAKVFDKNIRIY